MENKILPLKSELPILQAAFDKAYTGVVKQGKKSADHQSCFYRNKVVAKNQYGEWAPTGEVLKCGVGHCITDALIQEWTTRMNGLVKLEGKSPEEFPEWFLGKILPDIPTNLAKHFLNELQNAHDNASRNDFLPEFKANMAAVAVEFSLTIPSDHHSMTCQMCAHQGLEGYDPCPDFNPKEVE